MESVYKLSKYSQKIDEACRTNQLNKVMEYNKHELAYINKLSKYFGNQKGGAEVEDVVDAVTKLVQKVVNGKDAKMNEFLHDIDNAVEPKEEGGEAFRLEQLIPRNILDKVDRLVRYNNKIQSEYKGLWVQLDKLKLDMQQIHTTIYNANNGQRDVQQNATKDLISKQFNEFKAKADSNVEALVQAQEKTRDLQKKLQEVSDEATAELTKARLDLAKALEETKNHATRIFEVQEELAQAQQDTQSHAAKVNEVQKELAQAKDELAQAKKEVEDTKQVLQQAQQQLQAQAP
jgi:chromosome segregation ATPase